jgi:hypothetical protein
VATSAAAPAPSPASVFLATQNILDGCDSGQCEANFLIKFLDPDEEPEPCDTTNALKFGPFKVVEESSAAGFIANGGDDDELIEAGPFPINQWKNCKYIIKKNEWDANHGRVKCDGMEGAGINCQSVGKPDCVGSGRTDDRNNLGLCRWT